MIVGGNINILGLRAGNSQSKTKLHNFLKGGGTPSNMNSDRFENKPYLGKL